MVLSVGSPFRTLNTVKAGRISVTRKTEGFVEVISKKIRFSLVLTSSKGLKKEVHGALAQLASAPHWQCGGHQFESDMLHHYGSVVQLVRTSRCQREGRGFESLQSRQPIEPRCYSGKCEGRAHCGLCVEKSVAVPR